MVYKYLCALDETSLSIGRVKGALDWMIAEAMMLVLGDIGVNSVESRCNRSPER